MAVSNIDKIRNVALIAHSGAGKTSLTEVILFNAGAIDRIGTVEAGNTTSDFEPEEISRKISVTSSLSFCDWKGTRINLIDTPGFINFVEDTRGCLRVADGVITVICAVSGIKAETKKIWSYASEYNIPSIIFVNKLDKESANFYAALEEAKKAFGIDVLPLQLPIGEGEKFKGIIDIISAKAYIFSNGKESVSDIPTELSAKYDDYRKKLIEKIAETDDNLIEKYLEGEELTNEELLKGLGVGTFGRKFIPALCGSATSNIAIPQLLDAILLCLPSPKTKSEITPLYAINTKDGKAVEIKPISTDPFSAYVFKTIADPYAGKFSIFKVLSGTLKADSTVLNTVSGAKERIGQIYYLLGKKNIPAQTVSAGEIAAVVKLKDTNVGDTLCDEQLPLMVQKIKYAEPIISYAIEPKTKGDEEKVSLGLQRILEEDPTLKFTRDEESKEMILSGMGQVHLEVALERLKRKFGVEVIMKTPKIPYRETIKAFAKAQGKYKKQSGGRGQYGDCWIEIEPLPRGDGYQFIDKIVGGAIPQQYRPAVEKGILETMKEGILAGYPIVDLKVTLFDGSYHTVDSSEMAFKIAGSMALKKAFLDAKPTLLEPIMKVEVITPEDTLGAVIGDLNSKRGKVQGVESQPDNSQKIVALVPMAEMLTYANQLHSITSGRGMYSMEFSHYEEVPSQIAQKVISEKQKQKVEEH
ncbi:MAG: elongation factor G [Thermodesulfovibrionales bacterium]|nr:elongation factor G [Thermodesulfovibrionales bacterium]